MESHVSDDIKRLAVNSHDNLYQSPLLKSAYVPCFSET